MNNELNENDKKKVRLDTSRHVKRFLQSVINDYNNDLIPDTKAKTISTLLNSYTKVLDIEKIATEIKSDTEFQYIVSKLNEYLKPSEKQISIVSTKESNKSEKEIRADFEDFGRVLGYKIVWDTEPEPYIPK
ncbi:MAG: hypothetical protein RO257_08445 [Candidatus Kapabacteria bacterium]|jgi:hypothetical protein|nr:hypothetical protein [Candidatus Kapabacteria bacterium]